MTRDEFDALQQYLFDFSGADFSQGEEEAYSDYLDMLHIQDAQTDLAASSYEEF